MTGPLLSVEGLRVAFPARSGSLEVLRDVGFELNPGETLCVVGESGSGKSMTALALLGLVPPPGRVTSGSIRFAGEELVGKAQNRLLQLRGSLISMIFQEPMNSLNPVYTVGEQIAEVLRRHQRLGRAAAMERAVELLRAVRIALPERRIRSYPHQLSGGMRQRAMIAIAIACNPRLLIADEPTTALDVTVQKQILGLLKDIQRDHGTAILLITHDMGVVAEVGDRMVVMYGGQKVEEGPVAEVLAQPRHPYTAGLIACAPHLSAIVDDVRRPLPEIPGTVPSLAALPRGCVFEPRCSRRFEPCAKRPPLFPLPPLRTSACWLAAEGRVP